MAKQITFTVSKRGGPSVEASFLAPENLADARWDEVISGDRDEAIHALALQNLVIKMQSPARSRLANGQASVQEFINNYKLGVRTLAGLSRAVRLSNEQLDQGGFTDDQIAILKAAGVNLGDLGEDDLDSEMEEEEELEDAEA